MSVVDHIWKGHSDAVESRGFDISKASEKDVFFMGVLSGVAFLESRHRQFGDINLRDLDFISDEVCRYLSQNPDIAAMKRSG